MNSSNWISRLMMVAALFVPAVVRAAETRPPNVVIILVDDMGYGDIGCFGSKVNRTPNCDRLAAEGMKLTSFYAAPLCTPSRAQLLTGCYAKRVSLPDVLLPAAKVGISAKEHTIADLLHAQGYATQCIGKWHVGDQNSSLPTKHGFDHYLGLPYSNDMGGDWDGTSDVPRNKRNPPLPLIRDEVVQQTMNGDALDNIEQIYTDEAVKFIHDHADKPFFLYLAHTAVHVPIHPGPEFKGKSGNGAYGDWIEEMDASTGRVMAAIHDAKLDEQTFVFFTSDNGASMMQGKNGGVNTPLRGAKGGTYEGGLREPTMAWWPGHIAAGSTSDAITGVIDLLPTVAAITGVKVPSDNKIDGADISPLLFGKTDQSPRAVQYYFYSNTLEAVREGPWKMAISPQNERKRDAAGKPLPLSTGPFPKLYNLDTDIGETTDVAADHADIIKHLQELVEKMDADLGISEKGPGVRKPEEFAEPKPQLMKAGAPK